MIFKHPELPFAVDALEPHMSRRTLEFHHGKHHAAYVKKANELVRGTRYEKMTLEEVVRTSFTQPAERALFNNAAQAWNHAFFWQCLHPDGGGEPGGELGTRLNEGFGSFAAFRSAFAEAAVGQFGSGWAWLVLSGDRLTVLSTHDAQTPLASHQTPLLACDVWEHAYYLDYQNRRPAFVEAFLDHLVNWRHVEACLRAAGQASLPRRQGRAAAGGR